MYTYAMYLALLVPLLVALPNNLTEKSTLYPHTNETGYTDAGHTETPTIASIDGSDTAYIGNGTSNVRNVSRNLSNGTGIGDVNSDDGPPKDACPCNGGNSDKWLKVAFFNLSDPTQECPEGLNLTTYPVRGCGRYDSDGGYCDSVLFETQNRSYSKVCGRINAFQRGWSSAFYNAIDLDFNTIEDTYVSGVSLTHGEIGRRAHIWTFAGAQSDNYTDSTKACSCSNRDHEWTYSLPGFIGNDYFCDSGFRTLPESEDVSHDSLWDGNGCGSYSSCCNSAPFFCKTLTESTTDDLELRLCNTEDAKKEDKYISLIEIYVQ